jgi:predicted RNase H-like nuclease
LNQADSEVENDVIGMIVGIDCATEDSRVGLALADRSNRRTTIRRATICARESSAADTVADWIRGATVPVLLAIDAPLGWPIDMGRQLVDHRAGQTIEVEPNLLFRRATDRFIQATLGKTPLDIGADRIARTAHAALRLLGNLRKALALPIPLAWTADCVGVSSVEVYPAATLTANGLRSSGYKKPVQQAERTEIVRSLSSWIDCKCCFDDLRGNADVLDAAVCVLAAVDFLEGEAIAPSDPALAAHEGWIWTRRTKGKAQQSAFTLATRPS